MVSSNTQGGPEFCQFIFGARGHNQPDEAAYSYCEEVINSTRLTSEMPKLGLMKSMNSSNTTAHIKTFLLTCCQTGRSLPRTPQSACQHGSC